MLKPVILILFYAVLALPLISGLSGIGLSDKNIENRSLNSWPNPPKTFATLETYSKSLNGYFEDHFGMKRFMIAAYNNVMFYVMGVSTSENVLIGKSGELYLSHYGGEAAYSLIRKVCETPDNAQYVVPSIERNISTIRAFYPEDLKVHFLAVPTKHRIMPNMLPDSLPTEIYSACMTGKGMIPHFIQHSEDSLAQDLLIYPIDWFLDMNKRTDIFAKNHFHWFGATSETVARQIMETYYKIESVKMPTDTIARTIRADADLYLYGTNQTVTYRAINYDAAEIEVCRGVACIEGIKSWYPRALDVTRITNTNLDNDLRLLMISNSFGRALAPAFGLGFSEVTHINTNALRHNEREQFYHESLRLADPTHILYVFHEPAFPARIHQTAKGMQ